MEIYLDNGTYLVTADQFQLILKRKVQQKNRKTGESYTVYSDARYFVKPEWLFDYLLRKKISESESGTFEALREDIKSAKQYVADISQELNAKWKEIKER